MVLNSATGECFEAVRGQGSRLDGTPIAVSETVELDLALVGTGFPFKSLELLPSYLGEFDRVLRAASGVRRGGSAALDLVYLAQGSLDAFWEKILMPWDFAAGIVLVQEAGGVLARPDGSALDFTPGPVTGANSGALLEELRSLL